jgi:hypothetical protein
MISMRAVTAAGLLAVLLLVVEFALVALHDITLDLTKGIAMIASLLFLDAAQDADDRADDALSIFASIAAVLAALLVLFI